MCVQQSGKVFESPAGSSFTFGCTCNNQWNTGIHKISFKSHTTSYATDAIGITTNIKYFINHECWYGSCFEGYFYGKNRTWLTENINGTGKRIERDVLPTEQDAKPMDIISLIYDGDQGTLQFMLNHQKAGKAMKIIKNQTYYPFISLSSIKNETIGYSIVDS